jgi:uncharacterized protein (TIGR02246 family)
MTHPITAYGIAIARDQIRALIALYNNSGDRGRIDDLASVFAPDGVLELPKQRLEGREAIQAELSSIASGTRPDVNLMGARHHITTSRIELTDAAAAKGWIYFFVSRRGQIIEEGTYIDAYVRLDEGWRIAHRRLKMHYSIHDPEI